MEKSPEQSELERQRKIETIQDSPKTAKEVNLNKFPTTHAANLYLESIGWKRGIFRASNYNPFQNLANLERILRLEAQRVGQQLTQGEIAGSFRTYKEVIWFLYEHVNYKKDLTIDEEIETMEIATRSHHLTKEGQEMMKERVRELKKGKLEGRAYSKRIEEKRQKDLEMLKPEGKELLERVLEDINKPKKIKK